MENNKNNKPVGGKKNGLANLVIEGAVIPVAANAANKIVNVIAEHKANEEHKIAVPELYVKNFPIDLEQAKILIEDLGLKFSKSRMLIKEADPKYKDCFDLQVVDSNPKQKSLVNKDATVYVKYITQEVIDASKKIFEDEEKVKAERKEKKAIEKQERKNKRQEKVSEVTDKAKNTIGHIFKKGDLKDGQKWK